VENNLQNLERYEMTKEQAYEADLHEVESFRYISADWGNRKRPIVDLPVDDGESKRKKRKLLFNKKHPPKPKVPEHFDGLVKLPGAKVAEHIVEDIDPKWVRYVFDPVFVALVKREPNQWWPVVVGNARKDNLKKPPEELMTFVVVKYPQGNKNWCLFKSLASALHYCGMNNAAAHFSSTAPTVQSLPRTQAIKTLQDKMIEHVPEIAGYVAYNGTTRKKTKSLSLLELVEETTCFPTVVIPRGNDGSSSHAFVVVDDLIFDATQLCAMKLCRQSLDWICGKNGIGSIELAIRFLQPSNTKKRYARTVKKHW